MANQYGKPYPPGYDYQGHPSRDVVIHLHAIERKLRADLAATDCIHVDKDPYTPERIQDLLRRGSMTANVDIEEAICREKKR